MKNSKSPTTDIPAEAALTSMERFRQFAKEAESSVDYWAAGPITDFIEDVWRLMEEQKVSRAELARRLGTSRAYVTKLLGGNANFTLQTMAKVAMALGSQVHVHVAGRDVLTRWIDELPAQQDASFAANTAARQVAQRA
jgi:transcriptional regulator with XRE-family HTH domain